MIPRLYNDADKRHLLAELVRWRLANPNADLDVTVQEFVADLIDFTLEAELTWGLDVFGFDYDVQFPGSDTTTLKAIG